MNLDSGDLVRRLGIIERRLDDLLQPERGWNPHFLTSPYTNTNFDGDSFSDVAAQTKIENTDWSTTIPATAKALDIQLVCRDSGSAGTAGLYVLLYAVNGATIGRGCWPSGKANDDYAEANFIMPCTDGDIWYVVNASGANTMDIWLRCWGWWE